jgi:glycosyltransferase involved in cell wall biosynthesis
MKPGLRLISKAAYQRSYENTGEVFACNIQYDHILDDVKAIVEDDDITAALVWIEGGYYNKILVRYGYPSFRNDDHEWCLVIWRDEKGRFCNAPAIE